MRLEIKILAILFLLVGIYVGKLLPESQTDEKERLPEGLILGGGWGTLEEEDQAPDPSIIHDQAPDPWPVLGKTEDRPGKGREYRCPQGWQNPGRTSKEDDLRAFGSARGQIRPSNFLQKHYCPWCRNKSNSPFSNLNSEAGQLEDAQLFSSRRWNRTLTKNTVIAGGPMRDAKWKSMGLWCTHKYASVYLCWNEPENNNPCLYVGECKTFHYGDYVVGNDPNSGHLDTKQWLRCLDPEDKFDGGYHEVKKTGEKYKNVQVSKLEEPSDFRYLLKSEETNEEV